MTLELAGASAVVVAHQFNPSVVSEVWLTRHELLAEEEKEPGCVFTDAIVNVRSKGFNLLVTPDQLQFAFRVPSEQQCDLLLQKLGKIVDLLPHVPYHALGLNFVWLFRSEPQRVEEVTRRLFFIGNRPIFRHFDTEDAQFGTYLSKNSIGCRLKLDIKPVIAQSINENQVRMGPAVNLSFNFHLDILGDENPPALIRSLLAQWDEAKQEAEEIARDVEDHHD